MTAKPPDARPVTAGKPTTGRIVRLAPGLSYGHIRASTHRDVFFHRSDTGDEFNRLNVGDAVTFELVEDRLSGPRGIRVRKKKAQARKAARTEARRRVRKTPKP